MTTSATTLVENRRFYCQIGWSTICAKACVPYVKQKIVVCEFVVFVVILPRFVVVSYAETVVVDASIVLVVMVGIAIRIFVLTVVSVAAVNNQDLSNSFPTHVLVLRSVSTKGM